MHGYIVPPTAVEFFNAVAAEWKVSVDRVAIMTTTTTILIYGRVKGATK